MSVRHAAPGDLVIFPKDNTQGRVTHVRTREEHFRNPRTGVLGGTLKAIEYIKVELDDGEIREVEIRRDAKNLELQGVWIDVTSDKPTLSQWKAREDSWRREEESRLSAIGAV